MSPVPARVRLVRLSGGQWAVVDAADYELVSAFPWRAVRVTGGLVYAETRLRGTREFMHRLIMECHPGEQVDHRNGNGLDNRRRNLRFATHHSNAANRRRVLSASGFKGVTRRGERWRASIMVGKRFISLGSFATPEEAARAYDAAAIEHFGEFACTNADLGLLLPTNGSKGPRMVNDI
jgi:hypothetical protein